MSLEISRTICVRCDLKLFTVDDTTGVYDATSNPGGYGSPNPATSDVTAAYIKVTMSDGTIYTIDAYPTLPNTAGTTFSVTSEDIGQAADEQFLDDVSTIDYVVLGVSSGTPFAYTCGRLEVFMCNALCCVNEKMANIEVGCGCKSNAETEDLMLNLKGTEYAAECGKQEKALALLNYVNDKCDSSCTNC
jgi:hypothetical protein